nr:MAG: putative glycoprotein 3 [Wufeng rodent arterivirus 1]
MDTTLVQFIVLTICSVLDAQICRRCYYSRLIDDKHNDTFISMAYDSAPNVHDELTLFGSNTDMKQAGFVHITHGSLKVTADSHLAGITMLDLDYDYITFASCMLYAFDLASKGISFRLVNASGAIAVCPNITATIAANMTTYIAQNQQASFLERWVSASACYYGVLLANAVACLYILS